MEKYSIEEFEKLIEQAIKYKELEENNRLLILPCPLDAMVYQVMVDERSGKKKVMPCLFTLDLLEEYGKTVFGTESEAIIASVGREC